MRWKEKNASAVRALNGIEDDFLLSLFFNMLILKLNMRGNTACTMPPPPKKEPPPNIEHVLISFGRNTFRVGLGFWKLNKHKNNNKKVKYTACCSERSCQNHASSASITFCRLLMLSKRKQRVWTRKAFLCFSVHKSFSPNTTGEINVFSVPFCYIIGSVRVDIAVVFFPW